MKQLQLVLILIVVLTPLFILLDPLELAQAEHITTRTRTTTNTVYTNNNDDLKC